MDPENPALTLRRLVNGFQVTQLIHAAAELGLADALGEDTMTADELAPKIGAHARTLYRLMRALASVGVLVEDGARRFRITDVGRCLRADATPTLEGWARLVGSQPFWHSWGRLVHSVRTGENAFRSLHGEDVWEFRTKNPEAAKVFDRAMTTNARRVGEAVVKAYDFSRYARVADVGGGQGMLLGLVLAKNPNVKGVLFDLPHVVEKAGEPIQRATKEGRCEIVPGSFFETVPAGANAYVMKEILHDWEDEQARAILASCRKAIAKDGVLVVVERLLAPPNEGADGKLSDLNMLVMPGGLERTLAEYEALFIASGFRVRSVVPTESEFSVIEAEPI